MIRVSRLFLHPVKSCRGIPVDRARVTSRGLSHDRRWMVVDWDGRFVTARDDARLLGVRVAIDGDELVLDAPGAPTLRRPLSPRGGRRRRVVVWKDEQDAEQDDEASAWIGDVLGGPFAMVYMPDDVERGVDPEHGGDGVIVSFADGFPFLFVGEASLAELERRLGRRVAMERFRPTVVVDGLSPHGEDELSDFTISGVAFRGTKLCSRCSIVAIDPDTLQTSAEPLRTLREYRLVDQRIMFGINAVHRGTGTVCVGDPVSRGG